MQTEKQIVKLVQGFVLFAETPSNQDIKEGERNKRWNVTFDTFIRCIFYEKSLELKCKRHTSESSRVLSWKSSFDRRIRYSTEKESRVSKADDVDDSFPIESRILAHSPIHEHADRIENMCSCAGVARCLNFSYHANDVIHRVSTNQTKHEHKHESTVVTWNNVRCWGKKIRFQFAKIVGRVESVSARAKQWKIFWC